MIPVIALVGRPNVGKSTLFNRLTRSQQALVVDQPGVTRDRQFGEGEWQDYPFIVVDTGGIGELARDVIDVAVMKQAQQAIAQADIILFVVDARQGLTPVDQEVANALRKQSKMVCLVLNKMDGLDTQVAMSDFYQLGFKHACPIAASQNAGIEALLEQVFNIMPSEAMTSKEPPPEEIGIPKVAIIGRPNVGKSTLVNRMLGEERVIVCDMPGTTRDSIEIKMERMGNPYILIDTAGVRKKKNVVEVVEKFSAIKTLQAIKNAHIVLLIFDATIGLTDQDLSLLDFTIEAGRSLIICANKWDGMSTEDREQVKTQLGYRLKFADFAPIYYISALHGTGVGDLFKAIDRAYKSAMVTLNTTNLTEVLEAALEAHPPPLVRGRRIKLRYAHCGGHNPPTIIIHGNQTEVLPQSYQRYLSNYFIKALKLEATPVRIICKTGENPFAGKRNILTKRQIYKRRRLMKHIKKKSK